MQYYLIKNNTQKGPFPKEKLLENGLTPKSLVWREGLSDWVEADTIEDLRDLFEIKKEKKSSNSLSSIITGLLLAIAIILYVELFTKDNANNESGSQHNTPTSSITKNTNKLQLHSSVLSAEKVRSNSAILKGVLNSNSNDVLAYSFEYTQYGNTKTILATLDGDILCATVTDLIADTRCDYCIVEKQNEGTIKTESSSFTTLQKPLEINAKVTWHPLGLLSNISYYYSDKKKIIKACDYKNNVVRGKATQIASQSAGNFNIGQVCDIFDYCYDNWKYVNDPKGELYQKASNTIINGLTGDCDDFAVLVASMLLSIGGDVRVNFAFSDSGGHAFTELNVGKTNIKAYADYIRARYGFTGSLWYRQDDEGNAWLNLDWWARHPGGEYFNCTRGVRFYIIDEYIEEYVYK